MSTNSITATTTGMDEEWAVWEAMGDCKAIYMHMKEEEQRQIMQAIIRAYGGAQNAIKVYQSRERLLKDPNTMRLADISPREGVACKSIEFDNIKLFYHREHQFWNFYIARRGAQPSECIDWRVAGIKVLARGIDGKWGECWGLTVPPEARVRIDYPFGSKRRIHEIVFPYVKSQFPTHYLEDM